MVHNKVYWSIAGFCSISIGNLAITITKLSSKYGSVFIPQAIRGDMTIWKHFKNMCGGQERLKCRTFNLNVCLCKAMLVRTLYSKQWGCLSQQHLCPIGPDPRGKRGELRCLLGTWEHDCVFWACTKPKELMWLLKWWARLWRFEGATWPVHLSMQVSSFWNLLSCL